MHDHPAPAASTTLGLTEAGVDPAPAGAESALSPALPFAAPTQALRPPPGVALTGRRLKRGVPWGAVIVFGFFAAFWLAGQFGLVDLFFGMFSP